MASQSYSLDIRDTFFNAVARMPFFAGYTKRKNKMLQVQPDLVPYLGVYVIDETMTPDGDANAGNIRFSHSLRIGFTVMILNNDQDIAEHEIDAAFWALMTGLWTDPYLNNVLDTFNPDNQTENVNNVVFESITRGTRRHVYGNARDNETPLAELQYDVTVFGRSTWQPVITDDLLEIDIKTAMRPGDTQADIDSRIQVEVPIQFELAAKETPNGRDKRDDGRPGQQHHERPKQGS